MFDVKELDKAGEGRMTCMRERRLHAYGVNGRMDALGDDVGCRSRNAPSPEGGNKDGELPGSVQHY